MSGEIDDAAIARCLAEQVATRPDMAEQARARLGNAPQRDDCQFYRVTLDPSEAMRRYGVELTKRKAALIEEILGLLEGDAWRPRVDEFTEEGTR